MNVAILGASDNPERYSYKALKMLQEKGHQVFLVSPKYKKIENLPVYNSLRELSADIHTLTLYVGPKVSSALEEEIIDLLPKRVIFNPGAENPVLEDSLNEKGIETEQACTLVLLSTNQFS